MRVCANIVNTIYAATAVDGGTVTSWKAAVNYTYISLDIIGTGWFKIYLTAILSNANIQNIE